MIDQIPEFNNNFINSLALSPVTEQCIAETSKRFDLPEMLIKSILAVESGKIGELRMNRNGSYDIGPMQINSAWLTKFKGYITQEEILYNGCSNIQVGAWILRYNIDKAGNVWQGIGNYHSQTKDKHEIYRNKVLAALQTLSNSTNKVS